MASHLAAVSSPIAGTPPAPPAASSPAAAEAVRPEQLVPMLMETLNPSNDARMAAEQTLYGVSKLFRVLLLCNRVVPTLGVASRSLLLEGAQASATTGAQPQQTSTLPPPVLPSPMLSQSLFIARFASVHHGPLSSFFPST